MNKVKTLIVRYLNVSDDKTEQQNKLDQVFNLLFEELDVTEVGRMEEKDGYIHEIIKR